MHSIAYLGPTGTFTEQAVLTQPDLRIMKHMPIDDIARVLHSVEAGDVDFGVVAIENMIEGSVTATLDTLAFDTNLMIQREIVMHVNLNLLVQPGVTLDDIKFVRSYPVAYAQCRSYLIDNLPYAPLKAANSTAEAAKYLAESKDRNAAAIAPRRSAEVYGLEVLAANIEDHVENQTRFVLVGRNRIVKPTGHDKTTIVVYQNNDAPGSLIGLLAEFSARSINLTSLQSRPTKYALGQYCFLIDFEGHIADDLVADTLKRLHMKSANVKFIGSYPSAYGECSEQQRKRASTSNATDWISDIRSRIS